MPEFFQSAPKLTNQFDSDELLNLYINWKFSTEEQQEIRSDLKRFGARVIGDIYQMAEDAENNPPTLKKFDAWGNKIDEIIISHGWKDLDKVSAKEGLIAHGYLRKYGHLSRVYQFAKIYLFHASSAFYSCPLAMTDGAARLIELHGSEELKNKAFKNITSQDPECFWTSGQWMTEKIGGSDVSQSETIARKVDNQWQLFGVKWFTSATTSQMCMTLARIEENGKIIPGNKGLSLFYVELKDKSNQLNNIEILRLKEKLGTKALPTAELRLNGTKAALVGNVGEGVKTISSLLNITRIHNACATVSSLRRILVLAKDYANKRVAFKKTIKNHPLHAKVLVDAEVDQWGLSLFVFYLCELLGVRECNKTQLETLNNDEVSKILRVLTPVAKLYSAKINLKHTTELVESFGGAGYIENTGIPKILRDAQVFPIWEGTTNILSLDLLRVIQKEDALNPLFKMIQLKVQRIDIKIFNTQISKLQNIKKSLHDFFQAAKPEDLEFNARSIAFTIGHLVCGTLLLELATKYNKMEKPYLIAKKLFEKDLPQFSFNSSKQHEENLKLLQ